MLSDNDSDLYKEIVAYCLRRSKRLPGLQIGCIPAGRVTTSCIPEVETNEHLLGFCFQ